MSKIILIISVIVLCGLLLNACTDAQLEMEAEENMNITESVTASKPHAEVLNIESGDKEIYGKIYFPGTEEKCPAVIFSHGYNGCHTDFISECNYFSQNGFIACTFDFCGGSTRSGSSGKSTDMTIFTEKEDLLAVIDYVASLEQVDTSRIFLLGGSQGGLVTALAAEERNEQIRGMVLYFPAFNIPDDWRANYPTVGQIPETVDFWGLQLGREFFVSMREFNVYDSIGGFENEVLIIHGDQDTIAPLSASRRAIQEYEYGEVIVLPGEGHGFSGTGAKTATEKALRFMEDLD